MSRESVAVAAPDVNRDGVDRHGPDRDGLARRWARAIGDAGYTPMSGAAPMSAEAIVEFLRGLVERMVDALSAEPFDAEVGRQVGAELVEAEVAGSDTLGRTIEILSAGFDVLSPADGRRSRLLGALAEGFTRALWQRMLDSQEAIRTAAAVARAEVEAALRATEARFQAAFAGSAFGIAIVDLDGRLVDANATLVEMTGYPRHELRGRTIVEFVHPAEAATVGEMFTDLGAQVRDHVRTDQRLCRSDGQVLWAHLAASLIRDERGEPRWAAVMVEDVTDRHQLQLRLRHQALHDPLTGLPNRTLLFDRLDELFEAGAGDDGNSDDRVAICYIDLDGFKAVNDNFGHDVGDELLVAVAHRLYECVSRAGHLVARMGGDEFVILVHDHRAADEVVAVAETVIDALATPVGAGGHLLTVSASIGIVARARATATPADLMRAADIALYWAKADGKRKWAVFDSDRTDREVARYELSAAMPRALRRGEFVLEYQPLVLCGGETVIGAEALVRWRHPRLGLLAPDRFVGLAEETGMIVPLGLWVLEEACRQGRAWRDLAGDAAPLISVNLAVRQAQEPSLVDDVAAILERTGLEPAYLQLELTESALIGPGHEPLAALAKLAAMGVRIAIDDFGTGYSNLTYLRTLPVSAIKLAGSFVDGLRTQGRQPGHADLAGERMVATLVQLAHALDLTVTAEGVETQMQADRLRAVDCDSGQGFFYAPPGPPERVTEMITNE